MPTPLDLLIRNFVAPEAKAAGLRRHGDRFYLDWSSGDLGAILVLPNRGEPTEFALRGALGPVPWLDWKTAQYGPPRTPGRPGFEYLILLPAVVPPTEFWLWREDASHSGPGTDDVAPAQFSPANHAVWKFDPATELEACGERVAAAIREEVLPNVVRLMRRENLIADVASLPLKGWIGPRHGEQRICTQLLLMLDVAPVEELRRLLVRVDQLDPPPDPALVAWLHTRVDERDG